MSAFKPFPELSVDEGDDGEVLIRHKSGEPFVMTADTAQRLVDCWNACRKIYSPGAHIVATDEYVARLETLRKEAVARAEAAEKAVSV